jgi:hypothetical protein
MGKSKKYKQNILIGRNKRPAILETSIKNNCMTFTVVQKNKTIATRSTSKTQDEETAIKRLSKAVHGFAYVFILPVPQDNKKGDVIKRYYLVNN